MRPTFYGNICSRRPSVLHAIKRLGLTLQKPLNASLTARGRYVLPKNFTVHWKIDGSGKGYLPGGSVSTIDP